MSASDLMNEGKSFLSKGNYTEALGKFSESLNIDPNLPECNFYKGVTHQLLSQFDEALESFDKELSLNPNHVSSLISKGTTLCILDKKEEGIAEFDNALKIEPNNSQALVNKSIALQELNKYDESLQCLDSIEKENSNYVPHLSKANLLASQEKYDEALGEYKIALEKNPNCTQGLYNMGVCNLNLKKYDEAKACFDDALKINPDLIEALIGKATIEHEQKNYQEAINLFDEILKKYPYNDNVLFKKGVCEEELEKYEDAVKSFDESLKINPDNTECLYQKANCLENLGKKDEAVECYDKILEKNDEKYLEECHLLKGQALIGQEKYDEAKKELDEVIKINPNNANAYFYKGYINANTEPREGKEAIQNFLKCATLDNKDKLHFYNYGIALLDENYLDECLQYLYDAYQLDRTFTKPLIKIGEIFLKQGDYEKAIAYFDEVLKAEPNNELALVKKADAYLTTENVQEAMNLYDNVLKLNEKNVDALLGMGICKSKSKNYDEAIDYYNKVLELNEENPNALYNKAVALSKKGDKKGVNELLKKAKKLDDSAYILYACGLENLKDKKYDTAIEMFDSCIQKDMKTPEIFNSKAQALYGNANYEQAFQYNDAAINSKANYYNAWNTRANILDKLGKKADALGWYKAAAGSQPENALYLINYCVSLLENGYAEECKKILAYVESIYQSQKELFSEQEFKFIERCIKNIHEKLNNSSENANVVRLEPSQLVSNQETQEAQETQ